MEFRKMVMITLYAKQEKRHRCTEKTFGLCGRRWGWDVSEKQHVYYQGWNRSPAQAGCMREVLGPDALGRPRGIGWRARWDGGSGWGIHVTPWLIHVNVWQNPLKCCEVISLQLIKINEKKKKRGSNISRGLTKLYTKGVTVRVSNGQTENNLKIKIYKVILDFNPTCNKDTMIPYWETEIIS